MGVDWQKLLLGAAGAAAVGTALYYLLREEEDSRNLLCDSANDERAMFIKIMTELQASNKSMNAQMDTLAKEFKGQVLTIDEIYTKVQDKVPKHPLEDFGMDDSRLQSLMMKYSEDPLVEEVLRSLQTESAKADPPKEMSLPTFKGIFKLMASEMKNFSEELAKTADKSKYDPKILIFGIQAVIAGKVYAEYGLLPTDVEGAQESMMVNHAQELQTDEEFARTMQEMQQYVQQMATP